MSQIAAVFEELARQELSVQQVATDVKAVGMFRVRKPITVTALVKNLLAAIQGPDRSIKVDGTDITIHRPETITMTISGLRKFEFSPDFPVDVSIMRMNVSVDIRSCEVVTDEETGQPAVLVTTAGKLKPDLMIVCDLESQAPKEPDQSQTDEASLQETVAMLCNQHLVPQKYRGEVLKAVGAAYGPKRIAQRVMVACGAGPGDVGVSGQQAETVAKAIVQDLQRERVVGTGLLFWFQLGYWLVKIFTELLRYQNSRSKRRSAVVSGSADTTGM